MKNFEYELIPWIPDSSLHLFFSTATGNIYLIIMLIYIYANYIYKNIINWHQIYL